MTGNYFTGPNMSEAAAYQLAQETAALQRAAVTNQLLNETYRNSNVRQLGNRGYDVELAGQQNRADMIRNELANRMAIADKADQLARYQWQTPNADVTQRNLTARELAQMQIEEARLAREAQFAANYEALQTQRDMSSRALDLEAAKIAAPMAVTMPVDADTAAIRTGQATADIPRAASANDQVSGQFNPLRRAFAWTTGFWKPTAQERMSQAVNQGLLTRVEGASGPRYIPSGQAEGLSLNPMTGELYPAAPVLARPPVAPGMANELLRKLGFSAPASSVQGTAGPDSLPSGLLRQLGSGAIRLGSAALEDKRAVQGPPVPGPNAFVPAVGNPAAAPAPVNPLLLQMEMIQAGNANRPVPDYRNTLSNYLLQGAVR